MIQGKRSIIAALVILAGCSSTPEPYRGFSERTVGSLQKAELPDIPNAALPDSQKAAMRQYEAFLDESPGNSFRPEAMRRLAYLYQVEEQETMVNNNTPPASGTSRAAELYKELLERFPEHKRNDTALYQLAHVHEQTGELQPSMQALTQYTTTYQGTDLYDEAQFRRGEYLFTRRDYASAEQAYQAILDSGPASAFHQQALYKIGWARFKQNKYNDTLNAFIQLLDENISAHATATTPGHLKPAETERIEDSLRAICLSFSYMDDSEEIRDYFRKNGNRAYEPLVYAKLAALHLSKERFTDAAETYRLFALTHPQHSEAPLFQSRVIDVFKQAGFGVRVLEEKQAFVERYQPTSNYWNRHDLSQAADVMDRVQRHLSDVARHYHARALEHKKAPDWNEAGKWYRLYLSSFRESERAPYMNFLYGELLASAGDQARAAIEYERTAYEYGAHDRAAEAGYAAVLAYRKHETTLDPKQKTDWHRRGISAALRFASAFPEHGQAIAVRTLAAQQLYMLGDYHAAVAAARPVTVATAAPPALHMAAWTVIAHAQFDIGDFSQAEAAYLEILKHMKPQQKGYTALQDKLAASIYKQGEQARSAGDLDKAAQHFLRIANAVPASEINITAQYDAAAAYITLEQWPAAISILERWRRNNPDHQLKAEVTRKLAVIYQANKQPVRAAAEFGRIADSEKDPALRREAIWTMAGLYQQAGIESRAIDSWKKFVQQFPQPVEQSMEARYKLVQLYEASGASDKQRYWQMEIIRADREAGPQRSDRTRFLAAHAQLALTASDLSAYRSVQLREPLKKNLATKKKYLQATIKGYKAAAAYQVSMITTQATHEIGELYLDFGKALIDSERPAKLTSEELEQYEILLEEQAYPFEEKAIAVYETNLQRIPAGNYDKWIRKSMNSLAELMPVRYSKQEKGENFVAVLQ
mgnify:CR=1 FL=1